MELKMATWMENWIVIALLHAGIITGVQILLLIWSLPKFWANQTFYPLTIFRIGTPRRRCHYSDSKRQVRATFVTKSYFPTIGKHVLSLWKQPQPRSVTLYHIYPTLRFESVYLFKECVAVSINIMREYHPIRAASIWFWLQHRCPICLVKRWGKFILYYITIMQVFSG